MGNPVVNFNHMRIGKKGGGKNWTKQEVESRAEAAKKFERKKRLKLKIPDWLDDSARKIWRKTVKDMEEFGVLDKVDEDVLGIYCDAVSKVQEANRLIDEHGYTEINRSGVKVPNAYVQMSQRYAGIALSYSNKLGLNAESRARLAKRQADGEVDENEDLFN
ncbi:phage terminase small subunit P27 family [Paenibacillus spongiae]|uniref:Phage terminase small subunit P27 family n=1 Tax=Paenibacillus spongiae TaxID=2909671 RepID=A0ABY5S3X6_9BACL|nr:phage terminase small subunit P27 family [Paenibacillus spongiae]UVI28178.1 phage terminase small subunit P27 family [Paenibacillus spongiae]